jgi:arginine decarboxylase
MVTTVKAALAGKSGPGAAERASDVYGVENWGFGYFHVNAKGRLAVSPSGVRNNSVDLLEVVEQLAGAGGATPFLLRFPQILEDRVAAIHNAFRKAIQEFEYEGSHLGVYPVKVNQKAEVVETLVESGRRFNYGLEVGSKAELIAGLAQPLADGALIVCNGLKDDLFLRMAILAEKLGRRTILVGEDPQELRQSVELGRKLGLKPRLGVRVKLYSRGSGKWEESGGEFAKFGMGAIALVSTLNMLRELGCEDRLKMLHFHIGSQITDIRRAKQAFKEAARVYSKVRRMGFDVEYLNVGGGLGVDYDGSKTSSAFSVNYSVQEFANDVIYTIGEVCAAEEVPAPVVVTEAGRAMTAYHAMLITEVKKVIKPGVEGDYAIETMEAEAEPVIELLDIARDINAKTFREDYHDALQQREDLNKLFELGYLDLEEKAKGEWLFWQICRRAVKHSAGMKQRPEEFEELERLLASKYVCNFSMFQSLPDFWAFDQLFPIMPIHRLNEAPLERGILCDITCDSDGAVDKFVDIRDEKESLELHAFQPGEKYYLAFLLIGAYQETLGDLHNLFGEVSEATVTLDPEGRVHVGELQPGDDVRAVLRYTGYDPDGLRDALAERLGREREAGRIGPEEERQVMATAALVLDDYTYLA